MNKSKLLLQKSNQRHKWRIHGIFRRGKSGDDTALGHVAGILVVMRLPLVIKQRDTP